jgi:hypothetical protein
MPMSSVTVTVRYIQVLLNHFEAHVLVLLLQSCPLVRVPRSGSKVFVGAIVIEVLVRVPRSGSKVFVCLGDVSMPGH